MSASRTREGRGSSRRSVATRERLKHVPPRSSILANRGVARTGVGRSEAAKPHQAVAQKGLEGGRSGRLASIRGVFEVEQGRSDGRACGGVELAAAHERRRRGQL